LPKTIVQSRWFDDPEIVRQFPALYRQYARYCRRMVNQETGLIRGGTALFKAVRRIQQSCGLTTSTGIRCGDKVIYLDLTDTRMLWVLQEVMEESAEHRIMRALLKSGDTFIDIGANHGSFSVMASAIVGAQGMVIAFEPQAKLADLVHRSLSTTAKSRFKVHQAGCSDRRGTAQFYVPEAGSGSAGVFQSFSGKGQHRKVAIELTALDEVLSPENVTGSLFIKLDIEGSEYATLTGARKTIERFKPPILLELNPESSRASGHSPSDLLRLMVELGYENFCEIDEFPDRRELVQVDTKRQRNLLALHKHWAALKTD
jgi:FkbM family methyltransferase